MFWPFFGQGLMWPRLASHSVAKDDLELLTLLPPRPTSGITGLATAFRPLLSYSILYWG